MSRYQAIRKLRGRVFYSLSQTGIDMDGVAKYNDMVMVAGSAGHVLDHSFRMLDGRQFYHRLVGGSRQWRHSQEDMARTVACAGSSASRRA